MAQGERGKAEAIVDFLGPWESTVVTTTGMLVEDWSLVGVNEGSLSHDTATAGGVGIITTDTGDNDNQFLVAGPFRPSDGQVILEARLSCAGIATAVKTAIFVGFTKTLSLTTPVMPAETATTTTTYNGAGGMAGFAQDGDATANAWRFVVGDAGAALATKYPTGTAGTALGLLCPGTLVASKFYVLRVELDENGIARGYFGDAVTGSFMVPVGQNTAALAPSDLFYAVVAIENRDAGAEILKVDYAIARGNRNWTV